MVRLRIIYVSNQRINIKRLRDLPPTPPGENLQEQWLCDCAFIFIVLVLGYLRFLRNSDRSSCILPYTQKKVFCF